MRTRQVKPCNQLRAIFSEYNVTQEELAEALGRSREYVNPRMTGKQPWTMDDVYDIRAFVNSFADDGDPEIITLENIATYFPPRRRLPVKSKR